MDNCLLRKQINHFFFIPLCFRFTLLFVPQRLSKKLENMEFVLSLKVV